MAKGFVGKSRPVGETERLGALYRFERELAQSGCSAVAGLDEVGRGPLAGPVVAASVILPLDAFIEGLDDSKRLSPQKRERIHREVYSIARCVGVGVVDNERICEVNIYRATCEAMMMALESMAEKPDFLLIDALRLPALEIGQQSIIKGDSLSASIAAASVVAKVTRDRMMEEYDRVYPGYGFASHKGYATAGHLEALTRRGPCPIHRRSFRPVAELCGGGRQRRLFEVDGCGGA